MLSIHHFHDANLCLPPGGVRQNSPWAVHDRFNIPCTGSVLHGWAPFILSYMEQKNLTDKYRRDLSWKDASQRRVTKVHLKVFVCPSVPDGKRLDSTSTSSASVSDYGILNGVDGADLKTYGLLEPGNGDDGYAGAMAGFGDGSVRFLPESINMKVIAALVTRAGGESVKAP